MLECWLIVYDYNPLPQTDFISTSRPCHFPHSSTPVCFWDFKVNNQVVNWFVLVMGFFFYSRHSQSCQKNKAESFLCSDIQLEEMLWFLTLKTIPGNLLWNHVNSTEREDYHAQHVFPTTKLVTWWVSCTSTHFTEGAQTCSLWPRCLSPALM